MQNKSSFRGQKPRSNNFNHGRRRQGGGSKGRGNKQAIHPSKFVNHAVEGVEEAPYQPTNMFTDFALNSRLQTNLAKTGFIAPTAIQDQAIPLVLTGKDVIGLANTGTGKTAAFLLPILEKLNVDPQPNSVLIMAPTRELAQQIEQEFRRYAEGIRLFSAICVGGTNIERQIRELKRRPHVIIGTPGRLKDLINRRVLKLDQVNTLVLDEADRMLDMGFIVDIRFVANLLPKDRQTLLFSATMTPTIHELIKEFANEPEVVSVRRGETAEHIDQDVIEAYDKVNKIELLSELLNKPEFEKVLVFGETKYGVQRLSDNLNKSNIRSEAIHGNKSQSQRQRALKAFKTNQVKVLVATDVAARGLDIPNVSHVINFDQPNTYDDYVHRIGRTGRGGKAGKALTFVVPKHHSFSR